MVRIKLKRRKKVAAKPKRQQRMELPKVDPLIDKLSRLIDQIGFSAFENYKPHKIRLPYRPKSEHSQGNKDIALQFFPNKRKPKEIEAWDAVTRTIKNAGLRSKDITQENLALARRRYEEVGESTKRWIARMKGSYNGKRLTIDPATGDAIEFAPPAAVSESSKDTRRERRERREVLRATKQEEKRQRRIEREARGPSKKERIYKEWSKHKGKIKPEKLKKLVNGEIELSTVRKWMKAWSKGQALPACAKKTTDRKVESKRIRIKRKKGR